MSDTLRQTIAELFAEPDDPEAIEYDMADIVLAAVLADPTVARWKTAEEAAAYFISSYPTVQLAQERQWDPSLDALAKAVTPTASDSTIDSHVAGSHLGAAQTPESTHEAREAQKGTQ